MTATCGASLMTSKVLAAMRLKVHGYSCPKCGAGGFAPCITALGNIAIEPHAGRLTIAEADTNPMGLKRVDTIRPQTHEDTGMKMTKKLERAAGTLLTVNDRSSFDLKPVCALMKQAHDYILELEAENAKLQVQLANGQAAIKRMLPKLREHLTEEYIVYELIRGGK